MVLYEVLQRKESYAVNILFTFFKKTHQYLIRELKEQYKYKPSAEILDISSILMKFAELLKIYAKNFKSETILLLLSIIIIIFY